MGNGTIPLFPAQYNVISSGSVIVGGTYDGCIKVGATNYWIKRGSNQWDLDSGPPDLNRVKIPSSVWNLCKGGGQSGYTYDGTHGGWYNGDKDPVFFQWSGVAGGSVTMKKVNL